MARNMGRQIARSSPAGPGSGILGHARWRAVHVRSRGAELRAGLEALAAQFGFIRAIRGQGLMVGVDLAVEGAPFVQEALRRGLLINCTHDHILRLLPPFIIRAKDVTEFLEKFKAVLARGTRSAKGISNTQLKSDADAQPLALAATR